MCNALRYGPVPAVEAIDRIEALSRESGDSNLLIFTSALFAMLGQFEEARSRFSATRTYLEDRGLLRLVGTIALHGGWLERLAGDLEAADAALADGIAILQSLGETGVLSTLAAMRAGVLVELGRAEEAEASIRLAQENGAPDDIATQVAWRSAAAELAADGGRLKDAQRLVGEAIALVEPTDFLELRGGVFEAQAWVESRAGRRDRWSAALARAIAEYEAKGDVVTPPRLREQLAAGPPEAVTAAD